MFGKRVKTLIVAVLLALSLSIGSPLLGAPATVFAGECDSTACGCDPN